MDLFAIDRSQSIPRNLPSREKNLLQLRKIDEMNLNYADVANKMLKDCGVIRERHCRAAAILRRGEGKLAFTDGQQSNRTTARIYTMLSGKKTLNISANNERKILGTDRNMTTIV